MKKKGFTLVELLAVIIILSVIALIVTALIGRVIEKSKIGALENSINGLIESANMYYANNTIKGETISETIFDFENGIQISQSKLEYKGKVENGKLILYTNGEVTACIDDGNYYAYKNKDTDEILTGTVINNDKNKSTCSVIIEADSVVPTINNDNSTITFKPVQNSDKISSYFDINIEILGIKDVVCKVDNKVVNVLGDLYNIEPSGVNTTCNFTTVTNKQVSGTITFKSGYNAVMSNCASTYREAYSCSTNCHSGHCGACHGCCETACGWVETNNEWCSDCCCESSTCYRDVCVSGYTCPNGGTLSGTMCYY